MALPPVRPSQFAELAVQPGDSLATAIIKTYVRLPVLVYRMSKWMFKSDGAFTSEFRNWLCGIKCPTTPTTLT